MLNLPFCGPNAVDSFFCDLPLVIKLACKDTYILQLLVVADSGLLPLVCFLLLLVSYTVIIYSVRHVLLAVPLRPSPLSQHTSPL